MHLGFIRALLAEVVAKRTGILEVRTEDAKTRIYLSDGVVIWADQGTVGETLGRILTREKVINEASYEKVLEAMAKARQEGKPARFGEVVVEMGILRQTQVDAALAGQVQHKVGNCLKWEDVTFSFTPKESLGELRAFPIQIEPLLLRAMRLIDHEQKMTLLGEHDQSKAQLLTDATKLIGLLRLKTPEGRFVKSIDGLQTTESLLQAEVPDSVDPELLLCVLHLTGHLRFVAPTDEEKQWMSPSVSPPARRRRAEEAPPSTKRGRRKSALRSTHAKLTTAEQGRIKRAAHRLRTRGATTAGEGPHSTSSSRLLAVNAESATLVAEQQYRRGRRMLRENRIADAVTSFKRAVDLEPSAAEYRLYAAWASFRELPDKEKERIVAVRAIARRAVKENPDFGFAYFVLSHLAALEGNQEQAAELLRRARKLDPDSIEEEKPLRIAAGKGPPRPPPLPPSAKMQAAPPPVPKREPSKPELPKPEPPPVFAESKRATPAAPPASSSSHVVASAASEPRLPPRPAPAPSSPESDAYLTRGVDSAHSVDANSTRKKPRSILGPAVVIGLLVGAIAGVFALGSANEDPPPTTPTSKNTAPTQMTTAPKPASTLSTSPSPVASPPASTSTTPSASPSTSTSTSPSASPSTAAAPSHAPSATPSPALSAGMGIVNAPPESKGRRVFVDGKSIGEGPGELAAPCGMHQVQVGSSGKERTVDIPCGGKVDL